MYISIIIIMIINENIKLSNNYDNIIIIVCGQNMLLTSDHLRSYRSARKILRDRCKIFFSR